MAYTLNHALGRDQVFYVKSESSAGTFAKPTAAGDAARVVTCEFARSKAFTDRMDHKYGTRSELGRIEGKSQATWTCETRLIPSGTAGTAPEIGQLYKAAFGTETISASTSVTYELATTQLPVSSSLTRKIGGTYMEAVWGAYVNEFKLAVSGGGEPKVTFSGGALGFVATGNTTLDGTMSSSTTMVTDDDCFGINSVVQVGTSDNSSAGFQVTARSSAKNYTVSAAVSESDGVTIVPFAPSVAYTDYTGAPVAGITGGLQTFGVLTNGYRTLTSPVSIPITGFNLTLTNNIKEFGDEALTEYPSGAVMGRRTVSGDITLRLRHDLLMAFLQRNEIGTARTITCVIGTTAGYICTVNVRAELDFSTVSVPEEEEAVVTVPFRGIASSSGEDECSIVFT